MKHHVIPDSNVWISALVFGGKPMRLPYMALNGEIVILTSPEIIEETLGVLRDKLKLSERELADAKERIEEVSWGVMRPSHKLNVVPDDPDDNKGGYGHGKIMTVAQFLEAQSRQR